MLLSQMEKVCVEMLIPRGTCLKRHLQWKIEQIKIDPCSLIWSLLDCVHSLMNLNIDL